MISPEDDALASYLYSRESTDSTPVRRTSAPSQKPPQRERTVVTSRQSDDLPVTPATVATAHREAEELASRLHERQPKVSTADDISRREREEQLRKADDGSFLSGGLAEPLERVSPRELAALVPRHS
ncbi:hypothetical protein GCM10023224_40760 [Streptomonospora halophila]|uniref:Uncharacterized protein n=1 Tax=Streptomonospora halophila TaxID=427369 RepID=A0ABP9GWB3_9ACTN